MLRSFLLYLRRSLPMSSLSLHAALPIWAVPRVAGRFSDSETSWVLPGDFFEFNIKFFRLLWLGVASVLKKIVRLRRFFVHHISLESKLNGRQKVKGGNGSITASISTSLIASLIASLITLNLGVGCAPSCWPIFGFRTSWVLAGGAEGSFLCSPSSRFSGRGGGVGSRPRAWRRVRVPGSAGAEKKLCDIRGFFLCRPFALLTSHGCGGLGALDFTLAL